MLPLGVPPIQTRVIRFRARSVEQAALATMGQRNFRIARRGSPFEVVETRGVEMSGCARQGTYVIRSSARSCWLAPPRAAEFLTYSLIETLFASAAELTSGSETVSVT